MSQIAKSTVIIFLIGIFSSFFIFSISIDYPIFQITTDFVSASPNEVHSVRIENNLTHFENLTNHRSVLYVDPMSGLVQKCLDLFKIWNIFEEGILSKYTIIRAFEAFGFIKKFS
ncbi:MAG: hypothetical protein ACFFG0_56945 [Candidatus Thorarchaeota archaeon]